MDENKLLKDIVESLVEERKSEKKYRFITRTILFLFVIFLIVSVTLTASNSTNYSSDHVAVIQVNGMISSAGPVNSELILPHVNRAIKNDSCVGIILKINSPGGSATQSKIIFDEINKIRLKTDKKIYAVIEDVGASGGYYIAASAEKIFSSSSSIVGSIGVRLDSFNIEGLMDKLGIKSQILSSGKDKTILDPFSNLTVEHRLHLENLLGNIHNQFISDIKSSREGKVNDNAFTGLFWTGTEAQKIGLIDDLLSAYDVSEKFFNNHKLITYNAEKDILKGLLNTSISNATNIIGIRY
tara:strand:+ start:1241 stop:2134 length:894 start_codon:yes stop_codon:yes gene_type:complete